MSSKCPGKVQRSHNQLGLGHNHSCTCEGSFGVQCLAQGHMWCAEPMSSVIAPPGVVAGGAEVRRSPDGTGPRGGATPLGQPA